MTTLLNGHGIKLPWDLSANRLAALRSNGQLKVSEEGIISFLKRSCSSQVNCNPDGPTDRMSKGYWINPEKGHDMIRGVGKWEWIWRAEDGCNQNSLHEIILKKKKKTWWIAISAGFPNLIVYFCLLVGAREWGDVKQKMSTWSDMDTALMDSMKLWLLT